MKCPNDAVIRAWVDRELDATQQDELTRHVNDCETCRHQANAIAERSQGVRGLLSGVAAHPQADAAAALTAFWQHVPQREPFSRRAGGFLRVLPRPAWGAVAACLALLAVLTFAPTRSWAQRILEMLRVQKLAVVPVDMSSITAGPNVPNATGRLLAQMISDEVIVTLEPGPPRVVGEMDAASRMAGFNARSLDQLGVPASIAVEGEMAFHMTLDRDRIEDILNQAGRSDIQIPESVNGSTVAVHVPKLVRTTYGNCPAESARAHAAAEAEDCIFFIQVPSPTVSVPPGLNVRALAEAGLQVAGLSGAQAEAFAKTVDWSSTLVIPIPNGSSYQSTSVDGVTGTLVEHAAKGRLRGEYALIWTKNGVLYSLHGWGNSGRAVAAAQS